MQILSPTQLPSIPKRIISVVPSQTELLHYLGLEDETIGITKFCVNPGEWFKTKTRVGGTKSLQMDKIRSLNPDLILANKEENIKEQIEELAAIFPVLVTEVSTLDDALSMISIVGELTGKPQGANSLSFKIKERFNKLHIYKNTPACYLIWQNPFMTVGADSFISDMMQHAGFDNVFKNHQRYPVIDINAIKNSGCEILLLSSEPYPFSQKHIEELQPLLPAVKIILVDGEIFSWYGSRLLHAPGYFENLHKALNG